MNRKRILMIALAVASCGTAGHFVPLNAHSSSVSRGDDAEDGPPLCISEAASSERNKSHDAVAQAAEVPLAAVYRTIRELRQTRDSLLQQEQTRRASRVSRQLEKLQRQFQHPVPADWHGDSHVHAVGVYQQSNADNPVVVRVTDCSGPIVLVLTAYSEVNWCVELNDGVQVDFVICTGYERQSMRILPPGIPVFYSCYGSASPSYAYAYGPDRSEWHEMESAVGTWTGGLPLRTVQGAYYGTEVPFVIGPENPDWRVQMIHQSLLENQIHDGE